MSNRDAQEQLKEEVRAEFLALARPKLLAMSARVASPIADRLRRDPAEIEAVIAPEVERILAELAEGR